ncbi:acyl--CoA ligase [Pikeienuella piscinae]|uniref:Acyl--CoA ligase n=1 Tax=Pikeienuella piscinae TaxID=2748098 RepID=A0A7L5BSE0_9RHOB|nr:class I adenylate-forming enzyme family protein [Pikeienuella piscinae]QIE54010.1 acyl--CoA ligase [Pikeienuella piscinae]
MSPMTLDEAVAHMVGTDPRFALTTAQIRGEELPVFANAPNDLPALQALGRTIRAPGADFIVYEDERVTYDDWCEETARLAAGLVARGVRPGDRVGVAMRNYPEYLTLIMAIAAAGAVSVLINAWWTSEELEYGLVDSGAKLIFADGPRAERLRPVAGRLGLDIVATRDAAPAGGARYADLLTPEPGAFTPPKIDPDSDFAIVYTSGSTGHPKGVALTHRGAIQAVWSWFITLAVGPLMVETPPPSRPQAFLCATPLFHVTATHPLFLLSIPCAAKLVMMRKWSGEAAVEVVEREAVTRFLGVPTMCADIADAARRAGRTLPSLVSLGAGGAKRPGAQVAPQAEVFPHAAIGSGYGLTETNALGVGIAGPDYLEKPEAAGRLYPAIQKLKIADETGRALPPDTLGEICFKSATLMRGYLNKPAETAEAIRDGWLHTGDLGMVDAEGYLTIVDRKKNIIIRGGENISCLEVEGALHRHPSVLEAAVFPIPDERLGEAVGAALSIVGQVTSAELSAFLGDVLAPFKHPARYWFREGPLTRGATDKIDRRAIRAACLAEMVEA